MYGVIGTKYIVKKHNTFAIRRRINGKQTQLGSGKTLIIALMKRDWCMANDWKSYPKNSNYVYYDKKSKRYNINKWIDGKLVNFGSYKSLEDAQEERDKLVSVDWDIDAWCDLG